MSLADDLKAVIDPLRAIAGELGFRPYQVWVRKTVYAAPRGTPIGPGTQNTTDTRLLVGGRDPKVRLVNRRDAISVGAAELSDLEFEIGPLTPTFPGGGVSDAVLDPPKTSTRTTVEFLIKGPGLPTSGLLCQRVGDRQDRPLRIVIRVKSSGRSG